MMSLLTLFGGLKNVFKVRPVLRITIIDWLNTIQVKTYTTDTFIFRLHYKVSYNVLQLATKYVFGCIFYLLFAQSLSI